MTRTLVLAAAVAVLVVSSLTLGQRTFVPVTEEMLRNPSPNDWLMFSRTYDAQRFSPLNGINRQNVGQLKQVWARPMVTGVVESIPLVSNGVMYVMSTGSAPPAGPVLWALDAATGDLIWEYRRPTGGAVNTKTFAIFEDMVYYPAPDGFIVALDARTGQVRWETRAVEGSGRLTGGLVMAGNKVLSGRTCGGSQAGCYIAAHDARTGKELWKFYTAAGADDPGDASWGGAPAENRTASTWGLTGSYDPVRNLAIWGVANPTPNTRRNRHGGNSNAIGMSAPADLYSNSTVAVNADTGKLVWYYQHLPGDDWDQDYTNERILLRTTVNPNPKAVKWLNPTIPRDQARDISVSVGEGGGLFALDRADGKFLWAIPFPYDAPNFLISKIDPDGKTWINEDVIVDEPGERHVICAYNTKSYWPMAFNPPRNSLYIQYVDNCLDMTSQVREGETAVVAPPPNPQPNEICAGPQPVAPTALPAPAPAAAGAAPAAGGAAPAGGGRGAAPGRGAGGAGAAPGGRGAAAGGGGGRGGAAASGTAAERRVAIRREGSDSAKFAGIAKVNVATGELVRFYEGCAPGNGAVLTTAGDLVFWGDVAQRFRAFDADSGKILWETTLPGSIQNSTITYAVNGKQYVAVMIGRGALTVSVISQANIQPPPQNTNGIYVFALP